MHLCYYIAMLTKILITMKLFAQKCRYYAVIRAEIPTNYVVLLISLQECPEEK